MSYLTHGGSEMSIAATNIVIKVIGRVAASSVVYDCPWLRSPGRYIRLNKDGLLDQDAPR